MFKKLFEKDELRLLWPFYLYTFLGSALSVISAYYILYFLDIGIPLSKISFLLAATSFSIFLFDILTGAIADVYGRKLSVILSTVLFGVISLITPLFSKFYLLLILFILKGIVITLSTGSDEAWVISNLKSKKKANLISTYYSKYSSLANLGGFICALLAVFIVSNYGMNSLWFVQGTSFIFVSLILLIPSEHFKRKKVHIKDSYKTLISQAKQSVKYGYDHPILFKMLFSAFFFVFVFNGFGMLWSPILKDLKMPLAYFGVFFSLSFIPGVFMPIFSTKLADKFSKKSRYISLIISLAFISFLFTFFIKSYVVGAAIFVFTYAMLDSYNAVEKAFFQKFVPNKMRATIGSFKSTVIHLGGGVSSLAVGIISSFASPKNSLLILSLFLIPSIYFYIKIKNHGH